MRLIDFPDEILLHIFSHYDILEPGDLRHLALTCQRISQPAIVSLYSSLRLHCFDGDDSTSIRRINRLNSSLDSYPARALWMRSADFAWCANTSEPTIRRFSLLARFPAIERLKLRAWTRELPIFNSPSWTNRPRAASVANPSELVPQSPFAPCLRNLTIDDAYLSIADVAKIFNLPKVNCLNIMRFDETKSKGIEVRKLNSTRLCNLKELRLVVTSPPTEEFTRFIFQKHPHLIKLTWEFDGREVFYRPYRQVLADSVARLLQPLSATLLELRLSMHWWFGIQQSHPLDLSYLQVLKVLDVSGEVVLSPLEPGDLVPTPLYERLPTSLEKLIMEFNIQGTSLIANLFKEEKDWHWLLELSHQKKTKLPRLSHIRISPKMKVQADGGQTQNNDMVEWDYPRDLARAFHESNMKLQVTTLKDSDQT